MDVHDCIRYKKCAKALNTVLILAVKTPIWLFVLIRNSFDSGMAVGGNRQVNE